MEATFRHSFNDRFARKESVFFCFCKNVGVDLFREAKNKNVDNYVLIGNWPHSILFRSHIL